MCVCVCACVCVCMYGYTHVCVCTLTWVTVKSRHERSLSAADTESEGDGAGPSSGTGGVGRRQGSADRDSELSVRWDFSPLSTHETFSSFLVPFPPFLLCHHPHNSLNAEGWKFSLPPDKHSLFDCDFLSSIDLSLTHTHTCTHTHIHTLALSFLSLSLSRGLRALFDDPIRVSGPVLGESGVLLGTPVAVMAQPGHRKTLLCCSWALLVALALRHPSMMTVLPSFPNWFTQVRFSPKSVSP